MNWERMQTRFQEMKAYIEWSDEDAHRVVELQAVFSDHISSVIEDFYSTVLEHPEAAKVLTGGAQQITRLQATLRQWLEQLLSGIYDDTYFRMRWQVGYRHVEIGLDQIYTNMAFTRLRDQLTSILTSNWQGSSAAMAKSIRSLNKLLDLDLAIIQEAYSQEHLQRELELEREQGERKLLNLIEIADSMIVVIRRDHTIAYFSPYAESLTGYKCQDILHQDCHILFNTNKEISGLVQRLDSLFDGQSATQIEEEIRCRNGSQRCLIWNARHIQDFEDEPGILAIGYDITELKQANEKLLQANRLATIGEMNTRLAHESRNALQRLRVCTEMLEYEVEDNTEALRLIARAQNAQDDLRRLFDEVSNFASPLTLERTPCRISSLWHEAWDLLHWQRTDRQAELVEDNLEGDLHVKVDRFRLVQLFRNLFENSLAACDDPVCIHIECSDGHLGPSDAIEIHIRDNGSGLDEEARRMAFQPFYTTKTKGTGLGLAITQRIMDAHGGTIEVLDKSNTGAEFVLRLPRLPLD
jgi:two-component system sensor kinase FixL